MTKEEAKEIARQECLKRGWRWAEPVSVRWGFRTFRVWVSGNRRGGNVSIHIRKKDGAIVRAGVTPR